MNRREMQEIKSEYNRLSSRCAIFALLGLLLFCIEIFLILPPNNLESYNWTVENPIIYLLLCFAFFVSMVASLIWAYHYWAIANEYRPDLTVFCPHCNCKIDFAEAPCSVAFCSFCGTNIWDGGDGCSDCINRAVLDERV